MKSEREALNKQIKMLEDQLSTTAKPRVSRGTNTKNKTKEKEQQTEIDMERAAVFDQYFEAEN